VSREAPVVDETIDSEDRPARRVQRAQPTGPRIRGTVKWFNDEKGYGFIAPASGPDVFVHWSGIEGSGHRKLEEGQEVEFAIGEGEKGKFAGGVTVVRARE
jgi:CspA family cold shock protein